MDCSHVIRATQSSMCECVTNVDSFNLDLTSYVISYFNLHKVRFQSTNLAGVSYAAEILRIRPVEIRGTALKSPCTQSVGTLLEIRKILLPSPKVRTFGIFDIKVENYRREESNGVCPVKISFIVFKTPRSRTAPPIHQLTYARKPTSNRVD